MILFFIDKPGCHAMTEIMPGIKAIYQMEAEFFPYLKINFLPHMEHEPPGIILGTKEGFIRRYYTFDKPEDLNDLRKLIWHYLKKEKNIKPVTRNDQLTNLRQMMPNKVIQGWKNALKSRRKEVCCELIKDTMKDIITDQIMRSEVLDPIYKINTIENEKKMTRNLCKELRGQECGNNYPPNSDLFNRCMIEVNWLCDNGYPVNKRVNAMNKLVKDTQDKLYKYLEKNNMKVNENKFNEIITAGMFQNIGERVAKDTCTFSNVGKHVNDVLNENKVYDLLIENFDKNQFNDKIMFKSYSYAFIFITIILFAIILIYHKTNKKD